MIPSDSVLRPGETCWRIARATRAAYLVDTEAWNLMRRGLPATTKVEFSGSNVLSWDAALVRKVITGKMIADSKLSGGVWSYIGERGDPVELAVVTGATGYKLGVDPIPTDGIKIVGHDPAVALPATSETYFVLDRFNGVPRLRKVASVDVTNIGTAPVFVDCTWSTGATVPAPAHQEGDLLIVFALRGNSGTQPTLPAGWTSIGMGGDANAPAIVVAYKVAGSAPETIPAFTSATQVYCVSIRKAGGTPAIWPTFAYTKSANATTAITWGPLAPPSKALFVGGFAALVTDTCVLPPALTGLGPHTNGTQSQSNLGYSDVAAAWASATVTKTGGAGRFINFMIGVL